MNEAELRRERVVATVMARIGAAPAVPAAPRAGIDLVFWARPALAAAAMIIVAAGVTITLTRNAPRAPRVPATVAEAIGVDPVLERYVATGRVDSWEWLRDGGAR